jgi:Mg2+-importing ATPase
MNLNLLKETFVSFIRARGMDRHFRRLGMDMFRSAPVTRKSRNPGRAIERSLPQRSPGAAAAPAVAPDGLTEAEADAIREHSGPNEVEHEKPLTWPVHLWHCYKNPFNLLLTLLAGSPSTPRT